MCVQIIHPTSYKDYPDQIIKLEGNYLSEALKDEYLKWSFLRPVFIIGSTGIGKTTAFIELIHEVSKEGNTLLVTSRSATDVATKIKIAIKEGYNDILYGSTNNGLRSIEKLGKHIYVMTYQKLLSLLDRDDLFFKTIKFKLAIFDEIGYVQSDALYNTDTYKVANYCVEHFSETVKVFASATFDPIFTHIYKLERVAFEKRIYPNIKFGYSCHNCSFTKLKSNLTCDGRTCLHYNYELYPDNEFKNYNSFDLEEEFSPIIYEMLKDYKYVNFSYSNSNEEAIDYYIENKPKQRIVDFFQSIDQGKELHKKYPNSLYVDSNTKKINDINKKSKNKNGYDYVLKNETFEEDLLFASPALELGINLLCKYVSIMIVSTADLNQMTQMIGRIRVKEGETIDVCIVDMSKEELKRRLDVLNRKAKAINQFHQHKGEFKDKYYNSNSAKYNFPSVHGIFTINDTNISYNKAAGIQIPYLIEILEDIITDIENGIEHAYIKKVLKHFGREGDYNDKMWISYNPKEEAKLEFIEFLENKVGIIKRSDYEDFRKDLFKKFIPAYGLNANESTGEIFAIKKINNKFSEYNLKYELLSNTETYYTLEKTIEDKTFKPKDRYEDVFVGFLNDNLGDIEENNYKDFIENFTEICLHTYINTKDSETNKDFSVNRINSIFKEHELMYDFSKHSGTYYELRNIDDNEPNGNTNQETN